MDHLKNMRSLITRPRIAMLASAAIAYLATASICLALLLALAGYAAAGGWRFLRVAALTAPRDARGLVVLLRTRWMLRQMIARRRGIAQLFGATAAANSHRVCFLYEDQSWTFRQVDEYSNRVANLLMESGHRPGQVVAILAESRPQFACLWLGAAKAGVVSALINFNLRAQSLLHCLHAADATSLIFGAELASAVLEVAPSLPAGLRLYCLGGGNGGLSNAADLDANLLRASTLQPAYPVKQGPNAKDRLFYIYTSGTTGMPKAAVISHLRFAMMSNTIGLFFGLGLGDILYDCLPLYHTAGGILGIGQAFLRGVTVVIKRKFSASAFWDDCARYQCTAAQYIGEICRYLLAQPAKQSDRRHRVRVMFGNGLRPQIWREFQQRFGVDKMGEFYGATESNCNMVNIDNTVGAVGFLSQIAPSVYPLRLVRVDPDTGEPLRNPRDQLCVPAGPGEPGELIGSVVPGDAIRGIDGYVCKQATEKKMLRNVLRHGDCYFSTGDVLVMDELGYMYFRDRTGDTFRWKGENVEACLSNVLSLADCAVYGVEVPGNEGRAGMAAVADPEGRGVEVARLAQHLPRLLPAYARPLFLRIVRHIEATGTFKMKKTELRKDGFDPDRCCGDPLYYLCCRSGQYLALDGPAFAAIARGEIRF
uniref:Very long-chain fatty acid transport protein n=1 Tax=Macrostomum lignano TaxID=282301 RepID=A0A1I8H6I0_9PLAT